MPDQRIRTRHKTSQLRADVGVQEIVEEIARLHTDADIAVMQQPMIMVQMPGQPPKAIPSDAKVYYVATVVEATEVVARKIQDPHKSAALPKDASLSAPRDRVNPLADIAEGRQQEALAMQQERAVQRKERGHISDLVQPLDIPHARRGG